MSELDEVEATLNIELNIDCPHCAHYFDLLDETDGDDYGYIMKQIVPDGFWAESHEKFDEDVVCPNCKTEFKVKGVAW